VSFLNFTSLLAQCQLCRSVNERSKNGSVPFVKLTVLVASIFDVVWTAGI